MGWARLVCAQSSSGRYARGSELSAAYFADQVHYLRAAEREVAMPTLFDLDAPEPTTEEA
jgi:hypothetical protein